MSPPSNFRQHRNLLPLGLLALVCGHTILDIQTSPFFENGQYCHRTFTGAHGAAFVALIGCFVAYFAFRRFFKYVVGLMLLLGLFNVLNFTPDSTTIGMGFGDVSVGVQPLSLLLAFVYCLLNRTAVALFVRRLLPAPSVQQAASRHRHRLDQFKQTFARKSDDNLRLIVQERQLVPDAIAAAQELLRERNAAQPAA